MEKRSCFSDRDLDRKSFNNSSDVADGQFVWAACLDDGWDDGRLFDGWSFGDAGWRDEWDVSAVDAALEKCCAAAVEDGSWGYAGERFLVEPKWIEIDEVRDDPEYREIEERYGDEEGAGGEAGAPFGYIYLITNMLDGEQYVGQTKDVILNRFRDHYSHGKCHPGRSKMDDDLYLLGMECFEIEEIDACSCRQEMNDKEKFWIRIYDSYIYEGILDFGYNLTIGGGQNDELDIDEKYVCECYLNGDTQYDIARKVGAASTGTIRKILDKHQIKRRGKDELTKRQQQYEYYQLDDDKNVVEVFHSYAEIGRWAIENNLTKQKDESRAGITTRYAMLKGTKTYGYYWDSNAWTEEEKQLELAKMNKKKKQRKDKELVVLSRKQYKKVLQMTDSIQDVISMLGISKSTYYNWRYLYCLGKDGNDLPGWDSAPEVLDTVGDSKIVSLDDKDLKKKIDTGLMEKRRGFIYLVTNKINGKHYVGQTRQTIEERWKEHVANRDCQYCQSLLDRAIGKYGAENFEIEELARPLWKDLDKEEIRFIKKYDCCVLDGKDKGYNIKRGGQAPYAGYYTEIVQYDEDYNIVAVFDDLYSAAEWVFDQELSTAANVHNIAVVLRSSILLNRISYGFYWDMPEWAIWNRELARRSLEETRQRENQRIQASPELREAKKKGKCIDCGRPIDKRNIRCQGCESKRRVGENVNGRRPPKDDLLVLLSQKSFLAIGRMFGVSGNAVIKWCQTYDIPYHKDELREYLKQRHLVFSLFNSDIPCEEIRKEFLKRRSLKTTAKFFNTDIGEIVAYLHMAGMNDNEIKKTTRNPEDSKNKPVRQLTLEGELVQNFSSLKEAARAVDLKSITPIRRVCEGEARQSRGYLWEWDRDK